jgi:chemotaxis protein CheD
MRNRTETTSSVYFLYSSAIFAERKATEVQTVLGSCVSVCLFDHVLHFGGINHFMLPLWNGEGLASPKFGNVAIEKLVERMIALGGDKRNFVAKVFGGAEQNEDMSMYNIGKRNIQAAEESLSKLHIPVVASSVGGKVGKKILFQTGTGLVFMKTLGLGDAVQ